MGLLAKYYGNDFKAQSLAEMVTGRKLPVLPAETANHEGLVPQKIDGWDIHELETGEG